MGLALRTWWRAVAGWAFNGKYMAPYVPTSEYIVSEILKLATLTHTDRLFDVGCGDGRTPPPTHLKSTAHFMSDGAHSRVRCVPATVCGRRDVRGGGSEV